MNNHLKYKLTFILLIIFFDIIPFLLFLYQPFKSSESMTYESSSNVEILFVGDIMLAHTIEEKINEKNNSNYPFESTKNFLDSADYQIGNLECVLSSNGELIYGRKMPFQADPRLIEGIKYANFDLLTLANNHILDFGPKALNDTIDVLKENKIKFTGIYGGEIINYSSSDIQRPVLFEKNGLLFAFLSYAHNPPTQWTYLNSHYEPLPLNNPLVSSEITYVKENYPTAIIIVQIHWRISPQYGLNCNSFQKQTCYNTIDSGATIVSCHGPHTIQEIEAYGNGLILYSLGNYVFDLSRELSWKSMIAKVEFKNSSIKSLKLLPIYRVNLQYVPAGEEQIFSYDKDLFLNWSDYENFYTYLEEMFNFRFSFGIIFGILFSIPLCYPILINTKKKIVIEKKPYKHFFYTESVKPVINP